VERFYQKFCFGFFEGVKNVGVGRVTGTTPIFFIWPYTNLPQFATKVILTCIRLFHKMYVLLSHRELILYKDQNL
jgi:hypothetical protein